MKDLAGFTSQELMDEILRREIEKLVREFPDDVSWIDPEDGCEAAFGEVSNMAEDAFQKQIKTIL